MRHALPKGTGQDKAVEGAGSDPRKGQATKTQVQAWNRGEVLLANNLIT